VTAREAWRLLDDVGVTRSGDEQMAADLAMLSGVVGGAPPVLRLYRWDPPALSIGRFQPDADVDRAACERAGVEVVRRPTGGRALLHGGDLTYAVAMPRPPGAAGSVDAVHCRFAAALVAGLALLGVDAQVARHNGGATGPLCFASMAGADLRVGDRKLCGSAQMRRAGSVLQHGSILLRRLPVDEIALVHPRPGDDPRRAREDLRERTITLEELGVTTRARTVAEAVVDGFRSTLDVDFR
jgi:lipoate-protein ligase A